jgi:hypothetical protein
MSDPRAFASLSSGLLARKGGAKPAMRPQGFGQMGMGMDDLGWNDMGYGAPAADPQDKPAHTPSSIAALTPAPRPQFTSSDSTEEVPATPLVVEQQRAIAASFGEPEPASVPTPKAKRKSAAIVALPPQVPQGEAIKARDKTAFTLRLDAERHLRLRLACAVTGRSAQQIVTGALDEFLASLPELSAMAEQVPAKFGKRS